MPTYTVKDPQTGRTVKLTGDSPPSEAELTDIFAKLPAASAPNFGNVSSGSGTTAPAAPPTTDMGIGPFRHAVPTTSLPAETQTQLQAPRTTEGDQVLGRLKGAADTTVNALPVIGGTVGGIVGGVGGTVAGMGVGGVPGAIGGATLGGAAGESAKQLINRGLGREAPATSGEAAADIGIQGGIQGAGEATGLGLAKVASKAAPWLMNRALNLTDRLSREFPELSTTMIDQALDVTKGGLEKARGMLQAAKGEATAALHTAHAKGVAIPIAAATNGLSAKTLARVMESADIEGGLATLASVERKITAGRAAALTPMEADALKRSLQTQAKALYLAEKMGQGRPNVAIKAHALADMADSLNATIGDLTTKAGAPGYRAANAEAQTLIGAERGITKGIRPGANLYQAMVRPGVGAVTGGVLGAEGGGTKGAAVGALIGGALTSPAGMSRLAVALGKPGVQIILRGSPKLAAAVASIMAGSQQPAAEQPPAPADDAGEFVMAGR